MALRILFFLPLHMLQVDVSLAWFTSLFFFFVVVVFLNFTLRLMCFLPLQILHQVHVAVSLA